MGRAVAWTQPGSLLPLRPHDPQALPPLHVLGQAGRRLRDRAEEVAQGGDRDTAQAGDEEVVQSRDREVAQGRGLRSAGAAGRRQWGRGISPGWAVGGPGLTHWEPSREGPSCPQLGISPCCCKRGWAGGRTGHSQARPACRLPGKGRSGRGRGRLRGDCLELGGASGAEAGVSELRGRWLPLGGCPAGQCLRHQGLGWGNLGPVTE